MSELNSPCSYQGGKQRLAKDIVKELLRYADENTIFYDLCCGSGAVFLELINQGVSPNRIHAVDKGGFGYFWQSISDGTFDINYFKERIDSLPEVKDLQGYLKRLSGEPVNKETLAYDYLLLQAGAFGSKWIGISDDKWTNTTFRNYWLPTATSNRKSPVNPMMPMPDTLYKRVASIVEECGNKLNAMHGNVEDFIEEINGQTNCIVYIDPPYKDTTGFNGFDIEGFVSKINHTLFVSEGYIMPDITKQIEYGKRNKGNISGTKKKDAVQEILNIFERLETIKGDEGDEGENE